MLFHSSIRKEIARTFGATFVVLASIVMTMLLIRTVGLASRGSVDPGEVMMVLGYTVLGHAPTILTLSLFVAVVGVMSRMYSDSEMSVWFSSGRGLMSFLSPLLRFAWPVWLVITLLALFAWPWSHQQTQTLRDRFEGRSDLERVAPGQFQESASGNRVFFIDKDSVSGKTAGQVFIATTEKGKQTVTSAQGGRVEIIDGDRFLLLSNGQRLESPLDSSAVRISRFEQYGVLVTEKAQAIANQKPPRSLSTRVLLRDATPLLMGELSWRVGLALAAVNLVLLGLAFSSVNPRIGRNGNLVLALFTFIVYYNLINLGVSRIASGMAEFWRYNLMLHGGAFVFAMLILTTKHWNMSLLPRLARRRAAPAAAQR